MKLCFMDISITLLTKFVLVFGQPELSENLNWFKIKETIYTSTC